MTVFCIYYINNEDKSGYILVYNDTYYRWNITIDGFLLLYSIKSDKWLNLLNSKSVNYDSELLTNYLFYILFHYTLKLNFTSCYTINICQYSNAMMNQHLVYLIINYKY